MFSSKPYKRSQRVSDNLRREIANIFSYEINDPRLKSLTITQVLLSDDLSTAKIFVSDYINKSVTEENKEITSALENSKSYIKKKLGQNMKIKKLPTISFFIDQKEE